MNYVDKEAHVGEIAYQQPQTNKNDNKTVDSDELLASDATIEPEVADERFSYINSNENGLGPQSIHDQVHSFNAAANDNELPSAEIDADLLDKQNKDNDDEEEEAVDAAQIQADAAEFDRCLLTDQELQVAMEGYDVNTLSIEQKAQIC